VLKHLNNVLELVRVKNVRNVLKHLNNALELVCVKNVRNVLKHLNNVLELVCVKNVLVVLWYESAGNKIFISQEIIVQRSSKFQVPPLSVVLCHLSSYTAVRYPTCQENKKLNLFHRHFFSMAQQPLLGQGLLIIEGLLWHSHTPSSVGLLWTSDQPNL
jgi:hypothetical protein